MNDINLKQLEVFVEVVETGSFTEAASNLYLAQSTVSSHIKSLEEDLKVILFRREAKKHITLTPDGNRVYLHAKEILKKCEMLKEDITGDTEKEIIIGASTVPSHNILPEYIRDYKKNNKDCCITIKNSDSASIIQMVLNGEVQVGFVGASDNRKSLVYEHIAEDKMVMITPNNPYYAKLKKQGLYGKDLLSEPLIIREKGSGTQLIIDTYLSSIDITRQNINVCFKVNDSEMVKELVSIGAGVAILSDLAAKSYENNGKVIVFEMDNIKISRNIYMVYRKKGLINDETKEFIEFVLANKKM